MPSRHQGSLCLCGETTQPQGALAVILSCGVRIRLLKLTLGQQGWSHPGFTG